MPMPDQITLEEVNKAIEEATIKTDHDIWIEHFTSELRDLHKQLKTAPVEIREEIRKLDKLLWEVAD